MKAFIKSDSSPKSVRNSNGRYEASGAAAKCGAAGIAQLPRRISVTRGVLKEYSTILIDFMEIILPDERGLRGSAASETSQVLTVERSTDRPFGMRHVTKAD